MALARKFRALDLEEQLDLHTQREAEIQYERRVEDVRKGMQREQEDEVLKTKVKTEEVELRLLRVKEDKEILLRRTREDAERVLRLEDGERILPQSILGRPLENGLTQDKKEAEERSDQDPEEMSTRIESARRLSALHRRFSLHLHPESDDSESVNASPDDASVYSDQSYYVLESQSQKTCLMADVKSRDLVARFENTRYSRDASSGFYIIDCSWCEDGYLDSLTDILRPIYGLHRHVIRSHRNVLDYEARKYTLSRMLLDCGVLVVDGTDEWFESHINGRKAKSACVPQRTRSKTREYTDKRRKSTVQSVRSSSSISIGGLRDLAFGEEEEKISGRK
jgi:hypothetical protein